MSETNSVCIDIETSGDVPADELEAFVDAVAEAVHGFDNRTGWDPMMSATYAKRPLSYPSK